MKSILILLLIAITFSTFSLTAQHSYISSERTFTTKDGLSSDKIHALHKGSQGFIWIGTENGFDRFDGQHFVHFNKSTHPEMTLDRVQFIAEDEEGYLWLIEKNKPFEYYFHQPNIIFYHPKTGKWATLEERFDKAIIKDLKQLLFVKKLEDGSIFLYINGKGKAYNYKNGHFKKYTFPKEIITIADAKIKANGDLLLEGSRNDLTFSRQFFKINSKGQIAEEVDTEVTVTIQTNEQSLHLRLNAKNHLIGGKTLDAFDLFYPNLANSPQKHAIQIEQATWNKDQELLWIKNEAHLYTIKSNGGLVYQKEVHQDDFEMPILFDGHTTWYSDKQNGLVAIQLEPNHFQVYQQFKEGFNNSARGIFADKNNNVWISTRDGILYKSSDARAFEFERTYIFTGFKKDKNNQLWSFRNGHLNSYDLSTEKVHKVPYNNNNAINTWSMHPTDDGLIWLFGKFGKCLVINSSTGATKAEHQLPIAPNNHLNVYYIQRRDAQSIWLCTNQGLYIVDNHAQFVSKYSKEQTGKFHLPTNDVHHLYEDRNGTIWLATGDGLISWQSAVGSLPAKARQAGEESFIKQYTTKNGLTCDILHSVYEDDYEYLWLSSNEGLMQMDKRTGKVVTYTTDDGLLHNEFNRISHFKAEDGTLYFGGLTGVISFHPKHFSQVRHEGRQAPLVVTDFQQFSAKNGQFEHLTQELTQKRTIRLQHNDRFFKLNIALLDFKGQATYQYRIKNLYGWQTTQDNELNISGLPYGKYTLEIKAFNTNQNEAANTLSFEIRVLKPFYLQWWFLILVLGGLGTAAFYFLKWRTQQMLVFQETEQLRQLDTMKSQFFANISHELRTPITLILGPLAQLIKNHKQQSEDEIDQQLLKIQYNGKSLLNLVNEVLDLSKLEANKLELHRVPTKIPQFIERVVANFESVAKVKGIEYQFISFLQKNIVAQFDQPKLEKILNNLLSNAVKFTPKAGAIQIIVAQVEQHLVIKVKDSGEGISAEDLPHVFDRYFQTKYKATEGGTGIGLSLTKELVELMNGEILVQSELGEGTEFEIKFPIQLADNDEIVVETPVSNLVGFENLRGFDQPEISTEKDTILLVEDNPSLQKFIQSVLAPHYNVIITNNGVEALSELPTANCQLILSDVMMPEMDGFTLLEKVKSDDRFCSIPFIMLTARADINDKLRGLRIGVDDYMTKPFEVEELLLRIKNLIANVKNRSIEVSEDIQLTKPSEVKVIKKQKIAEQPVTSHDLAWLKEVETIAFRELNNKNFKADDLADELFISKSKLFRKIKSITGLSTMRYIKLLRLQKAKRILETQEVLTLTEVCYEVGLENTTHFAKAYEKEFGKRPHELLTSQD